RLARGGSGALGGVDVFGPLVAVPPAQAISAGVVVPAGRDPRPARGLGRVHATIITGRAGAVVNGCYISFASRCGKSTKRGRPNHGKGPLNGAPCFRRTYH